MGQGTSQSRTVASLLLAAVAGLAAFPFISDEFYLELFTHVMVLGIFAMSLDLLIGYTGLVSFGHAAFFGLAGYLLAIITPESEAVSVWISLPVCLAGAALAALVIGWFSVRTSGIYFIMITLAFAQMAFYYFNENVALGGSDGGQEQDCDGSRLEHVVVYAVMAVVLLWRPQGLFGRA